jgi:hypothetical protein
MYERRDGGRADGRILQQDGGRGSRQPQEQAFGRKA